ncbi:sugar transporter [Wallemia mellicola]|nr:sugar transporter [Wallemia mellicola]
MQVPVNLRASVTGSFQLLLATGQVIGAAVGIGSKDRTDTGAYRIPICINLIFVFMIFFGQAIIPESPRWLIYRDKTDRAEKALWKIHGDRPDAAECVKEEMEVFNQTKDDELQSSGKDATWGTVFKGGNARKLFVICGILICQQVSGIQIVFSYITVIAQDLNIGDEFIITIGVCLVELFGVIISFFIVNRFGRRPLLMSTGACMSVFLLIMGLLGVGNYTNEAMAPTYNKVVIAFYFLFTFVFNLAWGPLAWVCASELSSGRVKNKIMSLGTACFWKQISAFVVTFTLPYLYDDEPGKANLQSMVSLIYGFLCCLTVVFVYFFLPETRGRTLEEIVYMFENKVPTRHWDEYDTSKMIVPNEKRHRFSGDIPEHLENLENKEHDNKLMKLDNA